LITLGSTHANLVKPEEVVIVVFVLLIWIGVIALFVRKWGKIRGLEPYTPSFDRNNSSATILPLTSNSSQIGLPEPTTTSNIRGHTSKDSTKSLHSSHSHSHFKRQQATTTFHYPRPSSASSGVNIGDKHKVIGQRNDVIPPVMHSQETKVKTIIRKKTVQHHNKSHVLLQKPSHLKKHYGPGSQV